MSIKHKNPKRVSPITVYPDGSISFKAKSDLYNVTEGSGQLDFALYKKFVCLGDGNDYHFNQKELDYLMECFLNLNERKIYDIMKSRHATGYCSDCPYKSSGSVLHWLYVYIDLHIAERAYVSIEKVELYNKPVASFVFDDDLQMPIFNFSEEYKENQENQDIYLKYLRMELKVDE